MPHDFYPEIVRRLREAGCTFQRNAKGSHEIWFSPVTGRQVTVPRSKSRHLANAILRDAGVDHRFCAGGRGRERAAPGGGGALRSPLRWGRSGYSR